MSVDRMKYYEMEATNRVYYNLGMRFQFQKMGNLFLDIKSYMDY